MTPIHGFELIRETEIPEVNSKARLYRHVKTGAELLSLENDDENKVFGIAFRTPPRNSTGVAHIMEHSVLNGSRKYPVKEPFVELMKGSLNTFLNAMTWPDKTAYPVASQNLQDFYNLIDVYLDAVFYPLLSPYTFQQEGWHYELDSPDAPLTIKGVVYNEMKGVYSSPDNLLDEKSQQLLYPNTTYGLDSGGDPEIIPQLTYEEFKAFHDAYYHPSNARIYFYGDDDPEERLRILDAYLKNFEPLLVNSGIALQPRLPQPVRFTLPYESGEGGAGDEEDKAFLTLSWMLAEEGDPEKLLALRILEHALIGTPASPLRKALIESGLGEDLIGRGLETGLLQMMFSVGMKGIALQNTGKVEALILDVLKEIAERGIDKETLQASINTVEFSLREKNTGSYPRGLLVMLQSLNNWLYEKDPIEPLAFEGPLQAIKDRVARGDRLFEALIHEQLNTNPHRVTLTLTPDPLLAQRRAEAEAAHLQQVRARLSPPELGAIIANTRELKRRQEAQDTEEALATIPMLQLEDLDREIKTIPLEILQAGEARLLYHDLFTNGIVYMDLGFNLRALRQDQLPYLSLFSRALIETGTRRQDFVQLLQRIGQNTGGIHPTAFTSPVQGKPDGEAWMFLRGKAMLAQTGELLSILKDILTSARLDNKERIRQMVLEERAGLESRLSDMGHRVVNSRLRAMYDPADWASEQMSGVSYLFFLRDLIPQIDRDWDEVARRLEDIRSALLRQGNTLCNITLDREGWQQVQPRVQAFLRDLPGGKAEIQLWQLPQQPKSEALTMPLRVNYVGEAANLYDLGYQLDGSVLVITGYLRNSWLWERVRAQGGAYGAFDSFDRHSGVITFMSYRDPNLLRTLEVYNELGKFLQGLDLSRSELTKAIIGTIGDMDAYMLPDAKGYTSMVRYLTGTTDEERRRLRAQVLDTQPEDFHHFGQVLQQMAAHDRVVVLGSTEAVDAANQQQPGLFTEIRRVV